MFEWLPVAGEGNTEAVDEAGTKSFKQPDIKVRVEPDRLNIS